MLFRFGLIIVTLGLIAAGWTYAAALATVMPVRPPQTQLACAKANCIMTMEPCRAEPISGWNDSRYASAKAPGVDLRPCRGTTELAQGD